MFSSDAQLNIFNKFRNENSTTKRLAVHIFYFILSKEDIWRSLPSMMSTRDMKCVIIGDGGVGKLAIY